MERSTDYKTVAYDIETAFRKGQRYHLTADEMQLSIKALHFYADWLKEQKQRGN